MYTGTGEYASMLIDFVWDGIAWMAVVSSKNQNVDGVAGAQQATFPFIKNLTNVAGTETLGFVRNSSGSTFDTNERLFLLPSNEPRFIGSRYVRSWSATPNDLQSVAWETDNVAVATEAGAGPSGEDVDKVTFTATGGELYCWLLPHFLRPSANSDPMKFVVRFKAKMESASSGTFRVGAAYMGYTDLSDRRDFVTITATDEWLDFGCVLDYITGGNAASHDVTVIARALVKILFKSPSGSTGAPVLIKDVQVEPLREGYPEVPSEFQDSSIGASMVLAATAGSTGSWTDGTKVMELANGEFVDFQDSLEIGKSYLMICRVTGGNGSNFLMGADNIYWKFDGDETSPLVDAPFVFQYEGGVVKWLNSLDASTYTVNIYEVEDNWSVYDTEIGNTLSGSLLTDGVGVPVATYFAQGLGLEQHSSANLIPDYYYRAFYRWDRIGLTGLSDNDGRVSSFMGEYGVDGFPCHGTLLQDAQSISMGRIELSFAIPADTEMYTFSWFTRKIFNRTTGAQVVQPQYDNITTPSSRFLDIVMTMKNGVDPDLGGERLRLNIQKGTLYRYFAAYPDSPYTYMQAIDYTNWWRHEVSLTNDGTYTEIEIQIYPASASSAAKASPDSQILSTSPTDKGYVIIDWAQLELDGGLVGASAPIVGGVTRGIESMTTALVDGDLYDENSNLIGEVNGGAFSLDAVDEITKNVLWSTEEVVTLYSAGNLHEFGPSVEPCAAPLNDDLGASILDSSDNEICVDDSLDIFMASLGPLAMYTFQDASFSVDLDDFMGNYPLTKAGGTAPQAIANPWRSSQSQYCQMLAADVSYFTDAHGYSAGGITYDAFAPIAGNEDTTLIMGFRSSENSGNWAELLGARNSHTSMKFTCHYPPSGFNLVIQFRDTANNLINMALAPASGNMWDGQPHIVSVRKVGPLIEARVDDLAWVAGDVPFVDDYISAVSTSADIGNVKPAFNWITADYDLYTIYNIAVSKADIEAIHATYMSEII